MLFRTFTKCPKNDFFNLETFTLCHHIQHITLHVFFFFFFFFFFFAVTNLKSKNYTNLYNVILLLLGDVSLNSGPIQRSPNINSTIWKPLNKGGLHFLNININSLPSKKDEIRCIANKTKAAIIEITESKLGRTLPNSEINFSGYDILRYHRNRNGVVGASYIRKDLYITAKTQYWKKFENLVFDILLSKSRPITTGDFYRPPNGAEFMDLMV